MLNASPIKAKTRADFYQSDSAEPYRALIDWTRLIDSQSDSARITIVIPLRVSPDRTDALTRLQQHMPPGELPDAYQVLVVDDGSEDRYAADLRAICEANGISYLPLKSHGEIFSIGRCRNFGAMFARSQYIFFQDVDLLPPQDFYADILAEISIQKLEQNSADFLMVPCVYLTDKGTREFFATDPALRRKKFLDFALKGDRERIEKVSTGTSINLYSRTYYLARGGNDSDFSGWGYEDLEFNCRCIRLVRKFPLPEQWLLEAGNFANQYEYRSWKAVYRLFGDLLWGKGVTMFHAWHTVTDTSQYTAKTRQNRELFLKKLQTFATKGIEPAALPDLAAGRTLMFRNNCFVFNRNIQPMLGGAVWAEAEWFESEEEFLSFVEVNAITRVMFHNPYATPPMSRIYMWAQRAKLPFIIAERGALPHSLFYDPTGFLADSSSYDAELWDHPLNETQTALVREYVADLRRSEMALERQADRVSRDLLRQKLRLGPAHRILFVALQRPSDTATRVMVRDDLTYDRFLDMLTRLPAVLPVQWRVVIKKHPLEDKIHLVEGAVDAGDQHITDLLSLADAVLTFNSGVGVLAMASHKPVMLFGKAFYQIDGINTYVNDENDVVDRLHPLSAPDTSRIERFLSYLTTRFYSFGDQRTREVRDTDGNRITATTDIDFSTLRFPGYSQQNFPSLGEGPTYGWDSLLFDRYQFARKKPNAAAAPAPVAALHQAPNLHLVPPAGQAQAARQPAFVNQLRNLRTAAIVPAMAALFDRELSQPQLVIDPYGEFVDGGRIAYGRDDASPAGTPESEGQFEVSQITSRGRETSPNLDWDIRFRSINAERISWVLIEFFAVWDRLLQAKELDIAFIARSHIPLSIETGLYINRDNPEDDPFYGLQSHLLHDTESVCVNHIDLNKALLEECSAKEAKFVFRLPSKTNLDLTFSYLGIVRR